MAAADKKDSTNWTPLPRAASTDEAKRQLVDDIVNGRYPVRYVDEKCAISQSSGEAGRIEILKWRVGRLPKHFAQLGKFDWKWGFVTHAGRTLQRIEILFPNDVEPEPVAPSVDPYRSGGPGPPTAKQLVINEAGRRLANGKPCPKVSEFAADLFQWMKDALPDAPPMTAGTIENTVREMFREATSPPTK